MCDICLITHSAEAKQQWCLIEAPVECPTVTPVLNLVWSSNFFVMIFIYIFTDPLNSMLNLAF